ncbi:MAG: hybrid sensor histidine kinase/response regulator [Anaerolineales bacterium]|nr:hybrid sensor histidine kinase/response regulator [Anaerolineales bacterium]
MSNAKILVIDDEIGICEGIQRALVPEGYCVDITFDGEAGLQKIRENSYDLVLIDVMMPGVNGIDLIASIHAHDPETVCVMITGYATVELAVRAIKEGAYDFLSKPFSVDDLLLAVAQGIERRRLSLDAKRAQAAVAEAHRLEEEKNRLEELDRAKRQFIRLVTHDLQAPVSAIENYLKLIQQGYVPLEDQPEIIAKCLARTQEEIDLLADLLELGHLEVIETFKVTEVRLDEILHAVMDGFQGQMAQKNIQFEIEAGEDIPVVIAAPEQIKSLWRNLISNAIKYTPENGRVAARLYVKGGSLIGEVSDTGIGIPPDEQERLFSEFFRAKNTKEMDVPGTGLGLVIIKRIVEGMGGEITVESEPGCGSTFRFAIPVQGG